MAYMNQERKKRLAALLKDALKGVDLKYSLSVRNHSTIVMSIRSGDVDFFGDLVPGEFDSSIRDYLDINPYWYKEHFQGRSRDVLTKIFGALNDGNHDRSDTMTDYFDVGWYVDVNVGTYKKPYLLTK